MNKSILLLAALLCASQAFAAGYEKATTWSGHHAGKGGAAVADVVGAESLYFNPAGLSGMEGGQVSLNVSPGFAKFDGKAQALNAQVEGKTKFVSPFGILASYGLTPHWGFGIGFYVSGGNKAYQEDLDYSSLNAGYDESRITLKNDVRIFEYALGTGYEVIPGLKIGAAYRIVHVGADFAFATESSLAPAGIPGGAFLTNTFVNDLSATRYNGFKAGIQYQNESKTWGVGANWRSEISAILKGTSTGTREFNTVAAGALGGQTAKADIRGGSVDASTIFPQQVQLGGFYKICENVKLLTQYDWTEYAKDGELGVSGNIGIPAPGALGTALASRSLTNIQQGWHNQNVIRLGGEYLLNPETTLRAGYVWVSQVTASDRAKSTFSIPGHSQIFTLGGGQSFWSNMLEANAALEYAWGSASGSNSADGVTDGDFTNKGYAAHLGVSYRI